jgi:hypothetical protein
MIGTQAPPPPGTGYTVMVRIGLSTPVVIQLPGVASAWEAAAGIDEVARIAEVADGLGFDYLTCSEHVAVPVDAADSRGATYWDPLATLAFLAARTSRIRLATSVLVLGYHHPLEIAKRYGTLDRISGGRLVLGVGVGSLAPEFALLDAAWEGRGARADDAVRALRASLSTTRPVYDGEYFRFDSFAVEPCAVQRRVPIWVGGRYLTGNTLFVDGGSHINGRRGHGGGIHPAGRDSINSGRHGVRAGREPQCARRTDDRLMALLLQ